MNLGVWPLWLVTVPLQFSWNAIPDIIQFILSLIPWFILAGWLMSTVFNFVVTITLIIYAIYFAMLLAIPVIFVVLATIAIIWFIITTIIAIVATSIFGFGALILYYLVVGFATVFGIIGLIVFLVIAFIAYVVIGLEMVKISLFLAILSAIPVGLGLLFTLYYQLALLF